MRLTYSLRVQLHNKMTRWTKEESAHLEKWMTEHPDGTAHDVIKDGEFMSKIKPRKERGIADKMKKIRDELKMPTPQESHGAKFLRQKSNH